MSSQDDTESTSDLSELLSEHFSGNASDIDDVTGASELSTPQPLSALFSRRPGKDELYKNRHHQRFWYCKHPECLKYKTTTLLQARAHMMTEHGTNCCEEPSLRVQTAKRSLDSIWSDQQKRQKTEASDKEREILERVVDKASFARALVRLITRCNLPHNLVEQPEWLAFCLTLNWAAEGVIVASHNTIPRRIASEFEYQRNLVKQHLHTAVSCIQFCTDSWTSGTRNQKEFQAINAQWVSPEGKLYKALLAFPELHFGHGGAEVAPYFMETLKHYEIERKLGYITSDNHGANDKLLRVISSELAKQDPPIEWDPVQHRCRCFGHIVNLATQAFMFAEDSQAISIAEQRVANSQSETIDEALTEPVTQDKKQGWHATEPVQKLYNFMIACRNMVYHNEFKTLSGGRSISKPGDTRWNGWFLMIEQGFQLRPAVVTMIDRHDTDLEQHRLTMDDWRVLQETLEFLQPFYEVTKLLEGDEATLDEMQEKMDFLISHFKDAIDTSWILFNKYWELLDETPVYVAALLLHPSQRLAYLTKTWTGQGSRGWLTAGVKRAKELWLQQYKGQYTPQQAEPAIPSASAQPTAWERYKKKIDITPIEDDFTSFINAPPTKLAQGSTPISWWCQPDQQAAYPALSKMAVDCLSALPMSAESERSFSGSRRTISWERARLGGVIVEQIQCCKSWERTGLAHGSSGHNNDDIMVIEALETTSPTPETPRGQ
ncbi:hypothetical protein B0A49_13415 [Cryomyces minteri]|uniref:HAT C-terminal dimerisation domain-containing protein n=1 Tax=Cryomyces minteri TaxID=331657 RepID=A0A4U0W1N2_9PEZI|nr:hypothetical protein B0A49_13415 [Cryomyces minteri]